MESSAYCTYYFYYLYCYFYSDQSSSLIRYLQGSVLQEGLLVYSRVYGDLKDYSLRLVISVAYSCVGYAARSSERYGGIISLIQRIASSYKSGLYSTYFYVVQRSLQYQIYTYRSSNVFIRNLGRLYYRYSEDKGASGCVHTGRRLYGESLFLLGIYRLTRLFLGQIRSFYASLVSNALSVTRYGVLRTYFRGGSTSESDDYAYAIRGSAGVLFLLSSGLRDIYRAYGYSGYDSILVVIRSQGVAFLFRFFLSLGTSQDKSVLGIGAARKSKSRMGDVCSLICVVTLGTGQRYICVTRYLRRCAFAFRCERANFQSSIAGAGGYKAIYCGGARVPSSYGLMKFVSVFLSLGTELDCA